MIVYRLEHRASGLGVYRCFLDEEQTQTLYELREKWGVSGRCNEWHVEHHPMPDEDGLPRLPRTFERYGFESVKSLLRWFPYGFVRDAHRVGIGPVRYDVPNQYVTLGRRQVAFDVRHAIRLRFGPSPDQTQECERMEAPAEAPPVLPLTYRGSTYLSQVEWANQKRREMVNDLTRSWDTDVPTDPVLDLTKAKELLAESGGYKPRIDADWLREYMAATSPTATGRFPTILPPTGA